MSNEIPIKIQRGLSLNFIKSRIQQTGRLDAGKFYLIV